MSRKVISNGSDKYVCKYFDNGYCKFGPDCKFWHPEENCLENKCENKGCWKRHPKNCSYFRRRKCKFGDECKFKHDVVVRGSDETDEFQDLRNKLKAAEEANKKLEKELKLKDSIINVKKTTIDKNVKEIKLIKARNEELKAEIDIQVESIEKKDIAIKGLEQENVELKCVIEKSRIETICQVCEKIFENETDLENHIKEEHVKTLVKSKEFIARLQEISKGLINEKMKHKEICQFSQKCPHEMSCNRNCFFLDRSFVESEAEETEDSDNENESDENETDFEIEQERPNVLNMCAICNFEAKNVSGLRVHKKTDHKIKCESCDFKTTTKLLLKKHIQEHHQI